MGINRRQFLVSGAGLLAATAATGAGAILVPDLAAARRAATFQPQVRRSARGRLDTKMATYFAHYRTGGRSFYTRTFEGTVPGPTLRVRGGDVVRLRLGNQFPPNDDEGEPPNINVPHHFNTINLHTHGLHVSPAGNSDNVLLEIDPGIHFDFRFEIPADHQAGTYWYHPHKHGSSFMQLGGGMAGVIIIEGDVDEVPEVRAAEDLVMVIQGLQVDAHGRQFPLFNASNSVGAVYTLNGQIAPRVSMRPGEVQRWRLLNAIADKYAPLLLDGHELHAIAYDGITIPAPQTFAVDQQLVLAPGNRTDVMVQAGEPGTYSLRLVANNISGSPDGILPQQILATVVVGGDAVDMALPTSLPAPFYDSPVRDDEIAGTTTRQIVFQAGGSGFFVDGKPFDPDRLDQMLVVGGAEQWVVSNANNGEHPFHIHTNSFMVTHKNGVAVEPTWVDTVSIPGKVAGVNGNVTFRTRYLDFTGRMVLHCHLLEHEDQGMMQLCELVAPGETRVVAPPVKVAFAPGADGHCG